MDRRETLGGSSNFNWKAGARRTRPSKVQSGAVLQSEVGCGAARVNCLNGWVPQTLVLKREESPLAFHPSANVDPPPQALGLSTWNKANTLAIV